MLPFSFRSEYPKKEANKSPFKAKEKKNESIKSQNPKSPSPSIQLELRRYKKNKKFGGDTIRVSQSNDKLQDMHARKLV